jgi:aspartyl-tRNA(Asn)/glutamyl-tRNA(Gln) amidotransferase subunit C
MTAASPGRGWLDCRAMPVEIDIEHVARLARLDLSAEEKLRLRDQLGQILEHAAKVGEVAADDVPPTASAVPRVNVFREDEPEPSLPVDEALRNAPDREGDRFKVPRIVETGA